MFHTIDYLKEGTPNQQLVYRLIIQYDIWEILSDFSPVLAGTIPLGIDIEGSDADVICFSFDNKHFKEQLLKFYHLKSFNCQEKKINNLETIIARFSIEGFPFEIFGQNRAIETQEAYRHLIVEHRILSERGEKFKNKIIQLKKQGIKTEPAFAALLGLKGNAYNALLDLYQS